MVDEITLGIIGTFGTLALSINAFFLRGIFKDLNAVKITLAEIITGSKDKQKRLEKTEKEIETIREKFHALNNEIHQLKSLYLFKQEEERHGN